jgi:hypothetical protein
MAETSGIYFNKFESGEEIAFDEPQSLTTTTSTTNKQLNTKNTYRISSKIVFNDGTSAGILNNLQKCTKAMHLHEADVTLKALGLMLPSPLDITPTRVDSFRTTLMTLYEKPGHFLRILKKEKVDVSGSKLNIFVSNLNISKM